MPRNSLKITCIYTYKKRFFTLFRFFITTPTTSMQPLENTELVRSKNLITTTLLRYYEICVVASVVGW